MKKGYTLIEMLVAVTIVLLVAAIAFPVIANARRSGYRADSISNLRQIGQAIEMYRNDFDGELPYRNFDLLVETGYIKNKGILFSRADDFEDGYGYTFSQCTEGTHAMNVKSSYETLLVAQGMYRTVKYYDPDAAIVVDRTHGRRHDYGGRDCDHIHYYYVDTMLRLYEDTHVKTANFSIAPGKAFPTSRYVFSRTRLYSDLPDETFLASPIPTP